MHDAVVSYLYQQWCQSPEGRHHTAQGGRGAFEVKVAVFRRWLAHLQAGDDLLLGFVAEYHRQERAAEQQIRADRTVYYDFSKPSL